MPGKRLQEQKEQLKRNGMKARRTGNLTKIMANIEKQLVKLDGAGVKAILMWTRPKTSRKGRTTAGVRTGFCQNTPAVFKKFLLPAYMQLVVNEKIAESEADDTSAATCSDCPVVNSKETTEAKEIAESEADDTSAATLLEQLAAGGVPLHADN